MPFLHQALADPAPPGSDYPFQPVPFTAVHCDDVFWAPRIETNRLVTIPFAFEQCEKSGRMDNFDRAAKVLRGETVSNRRPPPFPFDDTDPYKVLEGASYALAVSPDPKLEKYLDDLIGRIASAQEPDGYLYTARTINPEHPHDWSGPQRWLKDPDESHELYNAGHLFEAAAAHYQATGKTNLLSIAEKEADLLCRTFGPGKLQVWPGHEIVEMGLAKLYRVTGRRQYLDLAKFFLDVRGPGGDEYHQSWIKPADQRQAVGHAVRAGYLYSGMADVAALTGDTRYVKAIDAIWQNAVTRKLYITGGIGAVGAGEAFGPDYFLPNMSAYCETCAAVANDYWNERLFLLHGDAKYVDVLERTLYNGLLSGVSLDGKKFFYPNPLESNGQHSRSPWFGVACCPGNMTRFLASVPGYIYAQKGDAIYVNLYVGSSAGLKLENRTGVRIIQGTRYPWDGQVRISIVPERKTPFTLMLRIPGWARGQAVPGDLYHFADTASEPVELRLNGKAVKPLISNGYVSLKRSWKKNDIVELNLPMPIRRIKANNQVHDDQGRVVLQRGPLVFCAEWPDNPDGKVRNLLLPDDAPLKAGFRSDLLNGVVVIEGKALSISRDASGQVVRKARNLQAIPYFAWANRGKGQMAVWLADSESAVRIPALPTIASRSHVTVSGQGKNPEAINDQFEPSSSNDEENAFFHWWPRKGTTEWVEYAFPSTATVSQAEVYWFDDTGKGECRVPASWRILYKDGEEWKPVDSADAYGVQKDRFNVIKFKPVSTSGLKLEVTLQPQWSAGIQEWKVE
ncbi:MAG TPA: glycoside hydrolase family 127 protein [Verrucomicrobiae bacterium]|nr:glycoside hydrolase family 127 protein [Verrucomicrobiae bacterium]